MHIYLQSSDKKSYVVKEGCSRCFIPPSDVLLSCSLFYYLFKGKYIGAFGITTFIPVEISISFLHFFIYLILRISLFIIFQRWYAKPTNPNPAPRSWARLAKRVITPTIPTVGGRWAERVGRAISAHAHNTHDWCT